MDMTPADVAAVIGCTPKTVVYHEAGACYLPRPWLFWGFAEALELTAAEMHLAAYYSMSKAVKARYVNALRMRDKAALDEMWDLAA